MDDGVLAGKKASVLRAVSILEEFGPSLGILSKCEVFSRNDLHSFPAAMKTSHLPHMVILGAPISDYLFCANFIASKCLDAVKLLSKLVEIATIDPQVALILLCVCGSFCKPVPPSLVSDPLQLFDNDVRQCFKDCFVWDTSDSTWQQVQLSLRYGGLGLRSLSHHSSAAFIASVCSSGFGDRDDQYLISILCRQLIFLTSRSFHLTPFLWNLFCPLLSNRELCPKNLIIVCSRHC